MNQEMTPCRESFVFYRSFYDSIGRLPERAQLALFRAVAEYGLDQVVPDFSGIPQQPFVEAIFAGIRPQLDANHKRFLNGCKGGEYGKMGGAPKGNDNARKDKQPQNNPKTTPNVNENENVNVNGNVKVTRKPANHELTLPFQDPEFVTTWDELRQQPKWRKKTTTALQKSLDQLGQFHCRFAVILMNNAIAGEYQGVVFDDTTVKYQRWLQVTPMVERGVGPGSIHETTTGRMIATGDNPYKD